MRARTIKFKLPLRGVHIGPTCIDGEPFTVTERGDVESAHSHTTPRPGERDRYRGFICARDLDSLKKLFVHELAHLVADAGHDDRWRQSVRKLGGRVPAAYRKRPRKEAP